MTSGLFEREGNSMEKVVFALVAAVVMSACGRNGADEPFGSVGQAIDAGVDAGSTVYTLRGPIATFSGGSTWQPMTTRPDTLWWSPPQVLGTFPLHPGSVTTQAVLVVDGGYAPDAGWPSEADAFAESIDGFAASGMSNVSASAGAVTYTWAGPVLADGGTVTVGASFLCVGHCSGTGSCALANVAPCSSDEYAVTLSVW